MDVSDLISSFIRAPVHLLRVYIFYGATIQNRGRQIALTTPETFSTLADRLNSKCQRRSHAYMMATQFASTHFNVYTSKISD
jgi:hypothetical protein